MRRSILLVLIVVLAAFALTGCGRVLGLIFEPNLYIDDAYREPMDNDWSRIELGFGRDGAFFSDAEYGIFFSTDESIDRTDLQVYGGYVSFGFDGYEQETAYAFDMDFADLDPNLDYWVGVIIDPYENIDEDDERDNLYPMGQFRIPADGGSLAADGWEPNNFDYQAPTFDLGQWHFANLHESGDDDWYNVYQMMNTEMYIETRPGPNGIDVPVKVDVYYSWDLGSFVYSSGPSTHNSVYIPPAAADNDYVFHIYSPAGELGEYEFQAYMF